MVIRGKSLTCRCEISDLHTRSGNDRGYGPSQSRAHREKHHMKLLATPLQRDLLEHPHVLAKVREEISSIAGVGEESRLPDRNTLKKMKYLGLVLKEGVYTVSKLSLAKARLIGNAKSQQQCFDSTLQFQSILALHYRLQQYRLEAVPTVPSL